MALFPLKGLQSRDIPSAPGVYIFRSGSEQVLYVGKARNLRKRVSSYLRKSGIPPRTAMMLKSAASVETIVTPTEKDALILEATLIKRHTPRYNIIFRDDKAYPFLRIGVSEKWPRLSIVRKRRKDRAEYFGPYPSSGALRETIRLLTTTFGIRTCTNSVMKNRTRPCLQYQIGKCAGPCTGLLSEQEYNERVQQVLDFFAGKSSRVLQKIKAEMHEAAEALEFEKAALLRDRIRALEKVIEKQSVVAGIDASWDCIGMAVRENDCSVTVLRVREGVLSACETRRFSSGFTEPPPELLQRFLLDFYQDAAPAREILIPEMPSEYEAITDFLSELWGYRIRLSRPSRGERKRLMDMAAKNAIEDLEQVKRGRKRWEELAEIIKARIGLSRLPNVAECIDISTTGGELPVGSLVAFKNGTPFRENYRIYNIKDVEGMDDFAMIHEVTGRRLKRALAEGDLPDLLVIDGGRGQLSRALLAVEEAGVAKSLDVISIAKERASEGEKIYLPGDAEPILLERNSPVLLFLQRMRDEAHRFGITAHRRRRDSRRRISGLSDIPGVGPARQRVLLETFGSADAVSKASVDEIESVKGIPASLAKKIYKFFHGTDS